MKKLLVLTMATTMSMSTMVYANSPMKPVEPTTTQTAVTPSIMIDRETLEEIVPAREVAENLGYTVIWNDSQRSITFIQGSLSLTAYVDSNVYALNNEEITLDTKTTIINDKAYIPLSFNQMLIDAPTLYPDLLVPTDAIPITPELPVVVPITPEVPVITPISPIISEVDPVISVESAKVIGSVIDTKIEELTNEQVKLNEEYKEAYLATGGTEQDYTEPTFDIGYEFLAHNADYVSVKVYRYQTLAPAYNEEIYYTFDSKTGELVTLEDCLGSKYSEYVKESVIKTATEREAENPKAYDYDEDALNNLVIDETTSFYLNENGDIVVVFEKYEIASGAVSDLEFIVPGRTK